MDNNHIVTTEQMDRMLAEAKRNYIVALRSVAGTTYSMSSVLPTPVIQAAKQG